MEVHISKSQGLRNDLFVLIERSELKETRLSIPKRIETINSFGIVRHLRPDQIPAPLDISDEKLQEWNKAMAFTFNNEKKEWLAWSNGLKNCKVPFEGHLERLGLLDQFKNPKHRVIMIGNRNLGNNYWFVAWQKDEKDQLIYIGKDTSLSGLPPALAKSLREPFEERSYTCLVSHDDNSLSIEVVRFHKKQDHYILYGENGNEFTHVSWCTFGYQVLKKGQIISIEENIEQFYDIRHVFAYDYRNDSDRLDMWKLYEGYPETFNTNMRTALELGKPRARNLHSAVGLSQDKLFILQRHGTLEEIAHWLKEYGAQDGVILDNSGSVACWAWWPFHHIEVDNVTGKSIPIYGGFIYTAPDYRPPSSSTITFILKGPVLHTELAGATSYFIG